MISGLEQVSRVNPSIIAVKGHLDMLIRHWRTVAEEAEDDSLLLVARCYIDAYQTLRKHVYGRTLPMGFDRVLSREQITEDRRRLKGG